MREYTTKVDVLMKERVDAKEAADKAAENEKLQEQQRNAYEPLLPLALPPVPGGMMPPPQPGHFYIFIHDYKLIK